jgi:Bacteriophage T4-like portal protein (Gp20)
MFFNLLNKVFGRASHPGHMDDDGDMDSQVNVLMDWWQRQFSLSSNRHERYRIFQEMATFGTVQTVLYIYSEETTQTDYDRRKSIWVESKHEHMVKAGNEMLRNVQAEERTLPLVWRMCRDGDEFRRLIYEFGRGILGTKYAPPAQVHRVEDKYDRLIGFREDGKQFRQRKHPVSWPWDYIHFRLNGVDDHTMYGTGLLAPLFRTWRQLCLSSSTLVRREHDEVLITELKAGDIVWAHDFDRQLLRKTRVKSVLEMGVQPLFRLETASRKIEVTDNHGLLVRDAEGQFLYKQALKISGKDQLVLPIANDKAVYESIVSVTPIGRGETYDIEVEDELHNFVANGIVSHNTLTEDAILIGRLRKAPDRFAFMIDVGSLNDADAMDYVNRCRKAFRKHEYIDPASAQYKKQYNPLTPIDDIWFPVYGDKGVKVENLGSQSRVDEAYDYEQWMRKFAGEARIPPAYLGFGEPENTRAGLLQKDVRFARTIKGIRKAVIYGYRTMLDIHYTLLNDGENAGKFDFSQNQYLVQMSPISYLDEFERLELIQLRFQLVEAMAGLGQTLQFDARVWGLYLLTNYAKIPEEIVLALMAKGASQPPPTTPDELAANLNVPKTVADRIHETVSRAGVPLSDVTGPMGSKGFWQLNDNEKKVIMRLMSSSFGLRRTIGEIKEYTMDDLALMQTDPSMLPVMHDGKRVVRVSDDFAEDKEALILENDLEDLKNKSELITEEI